MIPPTFLLAGVVGVAAFAAGFGLDHRLMQGRIDSERVEALRAAVESAGRARGVELKRVRDAGASYDQARAALTKAASATADARSELDRLRNVGSGAAGGVPSNTAACGRADAIAAGARQLLNACAEAYQAVEGEAGELAGRLMGLQGHARALESGAPAPIVKPAP